MRCPSSSCRSARRSRSCARPSNASRDWSRPSALVVANKLHRKLVAKCLPELPAENVLLEPVGRNTAPCIAWAASTIAARAPDSVQIVLPSDHLIRPAQRFRELLCVAIEETLQSDALLTLGVRPTHPATGYGYIELGECLHERAGAPVQRVARFVEKPDRARAEQFLASGNFLWNAGIFVWSTRAILGALQRYLPDTLAACAKLGPRPRLSTFARLAADSIDTGVLERAENVRVVPVDFSWSDVGSWTALAELPDGGGGGAELLALESSGCVTWAPKGELIALLGVHDLVVVHAGKVTLVVPRDRAQDVRKLVAQMEQRDPRFV
ncbi:MAG: mannose-1-phosphate guanylyltransferase [Planctomycetes bacterium]|nr:mannose-1-phosphate guanylyltransferase [Planctomycetota bacterium]